MNVTTNALQSVPNSCASCAARFQGFCDLLNGTCATAFLAKSEQTQHKRGEDLLLQGERTEKIGIIASGLVEVVLLTEEGEHLILQMLKPGEIVGDLCKTVNTFSWEAATPVRICWINRAKLDGMMRDEPDLYRAYLEVIARQLDTHRVWVAAMRGRNTMQRIAFWVLHQMPDVRNGQNTTVKIALTRRDLASFLDMTVETLCRGLYQLADHDAVRILNPELIEVTNTAKLRLLARCADIRVSAALHSGDTVAKADNPFYISQQPRDVMPPHFAGTRVASRNNAGSQPLNDRRQ